MARIRSIKPDFFASEDVSALPLRARLTWIGLWTHCDDHGRTKDITRLVKAAVWPLDDDVTLADVEDDLRILEEHHRIVRYAVGGKRYLAIVNWHVHQAVNRPSASMIPGPPVPAGPADPDARGYCPACSVTTHGGLTEPSVSPHGALTERPPPRRCPDHTHTPRPGPCGACADARHAFEDWDRRHRLLRAALTGPRSARCPEHPDLPAGRCAECEAAAVPRPDSTRRKPWAST